MRATTATLLLAVAFVLSAAAFGIPSLYVPGVALALLVLAIWAWSRSACRAAAGGSGAGPVEPQRGGHLSARGRGSPRGLPLPGSSIEHPLADRPLQTGTRPSGAHTIGLRMRRRGRHLVEPPALRRLRPVRSAAAPGPGRRGDPGPGAAAGRAGRGRLRRGRRRRSPPRLGLARLRRRRPRPPRGRVRGRGHPALPGRHPGLEDPLADGRPQRRAGRAEADQRRRVAAADRARRLRARLRGGARPRRAGGGLDLRAPRS